MNVQPFSPVQGATQAILPTASSQSVTLTAFGTAQNCIRVVNKSTVDVAVKFGLASSGAVTAVLPAVGVPGDLVVAAGATEIFSKGYPIDTVSVIGSGTPTGNVYITAGEGQ